MIRTSSDPLPFREETKGWGKLLRKLYVEMEVCTVGICYNIITIIIKNHLSMAGAECLHV
jgi:hypothetical protein